MILGLDLGYNQTKLVTRFGRHIYLSAIGNPSSFELTNKSTILEDNLTVKIDGTLYYVGNKALSTNNARLCTDTYKSNNISDKVLLYAALGITCLESNETTFQIVTGLPVEDFEKPGLKDALLNIILGRHHFEFCGHSMDILVDDALIIPQAAGAFYDYILDDTGAVKTSNISMLEGTVIVVDIGYKTTDVITMAYGEYISKKSCTIVKGMRDVHKELARYINSKYDRNFSLADMDSICKAGWFIHEGEMIDISNIVLDIERPIVEFIINETNAIVGDTKGTNLVIGSGGAMSIMAEYYTQYYNGYFEVGDMEFANASGDYKYWMFYESIR